LKSFLRGHITFLGKGGKDEKVQGEKKKEIEKSDRKTEWCSTTKPSVARSIGRQITTGKGGGEKHHSLKSLTPKTAIVSEMGHGSGTCRRSVESEAD